MSNLILELKNITLEDRYIIGEKAYNLSKLYNDGFNVPESLVLSTNFFQEFLDFNNLEFNSELPEKILYSKFSQSLIDLLKTNVGKLWNNEKIPLVCRSSSTLEDNVGLSFAGQFCTLLGITSFQDLLESIKICWSQCLKTKISNYCKLTEVTFYKNIALIIQVLVDSYKAGITFIQPSQDSDNNEIIIECTWGTGIALTDGLVTPDRICIIGDNISYICNNKKIGIFSLPDLDAFDIGDSIEIHNIWMNSSSSAKIIQKDPFGRLAYISIPSDMAGEKCLLMSEVIKVKSTVMEIQEKYGNQDVEWCINAYGELFILQSRPITSKVKYIDMKELDDREDDVLFHGVTVSTGRTFGEVKVVTNSNDFDKVASGDILVCQNTSPEYFDILTKVSGVISEQGGILSHTAIVCRELGIPCLVECNRATWNLSDYDYVLLDADNGVVKNAIRKNNTFDNQNNRDSIVENISFNEVIDFTTISDERFTVIAPIMSIYAFLNYCIKHDKVSTLELFLTYFESKIKRMKNKVLILDLSYPEIIDQQQFLDEILRSSKILSYFKIVLTDDCLKSNSKYEGEVLTRQQFIKLYEIEERGNLL